VQGVYGVVRCVVVVVVAVVVAVVVVKMRMKMKMKRSERGGVQHGTITPLGSRCR